MWSRRWVVVAVFAAAFACNALTGVSDLAPDEIADAGGTDASRDATTADVPEGADAGPEADAGPDGQSRPSYCEGIVFYARYDATLTSAEGYAVEPPAPTTTYGSGKFGQSAYVSTANLAAYYAVDGGVPYSLAAGSVAFWFKPSWAFPSSSARIFAKSVVDRSGNLNTTGPAVMLDVTTPRLGVFVKDASNVEQAAAAMTLLEAQPFWKDLDWNHFVETWRESPSLVTFTLNGGGADGGAHRETTTTWSPAFPAPIYFRVDSPTAPTDGNFDEVTVWSRPLAPEEASALAAAGAPTGDVCGL